MIPWDYEPGHLIRQLEVEVDNLRRENDYLKHRIEELENKEHGIEYRRPFKKRLL